MNKILFRQIWNERRSNAWIWLELLLVSVVLWFVVDTSYVTLNTYFEPRGFDISNTYWIRVGTMTPKSPDYIDPSTRNVKAGSDILELLKRLRHFPDVEAVSLSYNSFPYNGSWSGTYAKIDTMGEECRIYKVSPDFLRVFRYHGSNGETPEKLATLLKEGVLIVGENLLTAKYELKGKDIAGRSVYLSADTTKVWPVVAVTKPVRFNDFVSTYDCRYVMQIYSEASAVNLTENDVRFLELCIRTRPDCPPGFIDRLRNASRSQFTIGNLLFEDVRSLDDIRCMLQLDDMNKLRDQMWGIGFLLFNIFLGLLGTFWFRTQQRRSEMALHVSCGSTRREVFARLIIEGLLLLVSATIIALFIDANIAYAEFIPQMNGSFLTVGRFLITTFITFVLMSLMIVIGIWFPARQAMKIQPAEALREE
jgi:putative ABC transport system permease protein